MRTSKEIKDEGNEILGFSSSSTKFILEVLLDIREQNTKIIYNLNYLCKK